MIDASMAQDAETLLSNGRSDEDVERLTGMNLDDIVVLRAEAASAPVTRAPGLTKVIRPALVVRRPVTRPAGAPPSARNR